MRERDLYGVVFLLAAAASLFCVVGWGTGLANELAGIGSFIFAAVAAVPAIAAWKRTASKSAVSQPKHREDPEARYRRGAEAGDAWAMFYLGLWLKKHGDLDGAERWLRQAADTGNVNAMYQLSNLLEEQGDYTQAVYWLTKAARS